MNFRIIALGLLAKDAFERNLEMVALNQQRMARMSMMEIAAYLRSITPRRSGYMANAVRGYGFRRRGRWGFEFKVGWRASDFPGVFHAPFTLYGTGIYGLYGKPITPRQAPRLAWQDKRGNWISKSETIGQRPRPILKQAQNFGVKLLRGNIQRAYIRAMRTGT